MIFSRCKKRLLLLNCCFALSVFCATAQKIVQLEAPDGKTRFRLFADEEGKVGYDIFYRQQEVIERSSLGLTGWSDHLHLTAVHQDNRNTSWKPVYGERNLVHDQYHAGTFTFEGNGKQQLQIEVRVYNEGVAFRYYFPGAAGSKVRVQKDLSTFTLPMGTMAWFTNHAQGSYRLLPLEKWPSGAERPLTLQLKNGLYAALAEAEVVDYCRTYFALDSAKANTIACAMYEPVELSKPFSTPWRVIMIAEKPTQLLQHNDLLLNLNLPCAIKNTAWIKPGKVMREMTLSTDGAKKEIDFAVKRHLQYIHFDAGWYGYEYDTAADASHVQVDPRRNPKNDLDLREVIGYAKQHGIGVFLYVNQIALAKQLDSLLPLYEKWGVAGIKFGFVNVGSYKWTSWLHEAVKKCAHYHLMVDIHDEYRPTGFSRTYPNLLTQEGVRGNEEMPDATHNTVLPFTRFLCGAADYTICYYHRPELKSRLAETQNAHVLKTTSVHQMALSIVYYSPLQFLYWYDKPEDSQDDPELKFFDAVPTVWDDTRIVDGAIGEYITVARKSGTDWYVGTITNNDARDVKINCSFLSPGMRYKAEIYYDDPASPVRTKVSIKQVEVSASSILDTHLLASGGEAIRFTQLK